MTQVKLKRVYDKESATDGFRVLVDRLYPRGIKKENLHYDVWAKEVAPSSDLRKWYHEDKEGRWSEFSKKYINELKKSPSVEHFVSQLKKHSVVTLLYASKDTGHNHAAVLQHYLEELLK